ncbi:MAG: GNAT family N-acetyltransferase [Candidatus Omnitrophica bacterium]|nr:GNAT family N-acetyltransferase [Candidatus Omnitrophota bacterium]
MRYSKDIRLKIGDATLSFRYLAWDTDFFGKKSFILDLDGPCLDISDKMADTAASSLKNYFVTAKVCSSCGKGIVNFLQKAGFKYIDTEVILKYQSLRQMSAKVDEKVGNIRVVELKDNKNLPYEELGASFTKTRFHNDVNIPPDKADRLWINYLRNYKVTPLRHIFAVTVGARVGGVILVNENKNPRKAVLSFVAVLNDFRNTGIGSKLIGYVAKKFKTMDIFTETQVSNKAALNFYMKNGFSRMEGVKTILHRW